MLKDRFGRNIDYLRISVTDRCNLRCIYCHDGFFEKYPRSSIMSTEEILMLISHLKERGLKKVKITGGEPLLRKDITNIVRKVRSLGMDVSLTTNGVLLEEMAKDLYESGLKRINIGLDCLDKGLFKNITGFDKYTQVTKGLGKAIDIGFNPVKINVVLIKGLNSDTEPWIRLIKDKDITVRFVEAMPFVNGFEPVRNDGLKKEFAKLGKIVPADVEGCGPAKHFKIEGFKGKIGFISPLSARFCDGCDRLRINAMGQFRNCLFSQDKYDFLSLARNGFSQTKLDDLVDLVLTGKPKDNEGLRPVENMCQIGG